ncbi:hypothetical protein JYB62_10235 [Algoriphagus lutimaris]|uniref:hypothetical protein n=1 Tax=Algoriphagus lutimaris TaxID=613197 RepID=UPI00196AD1EE|nr:hypothetical protein [Algoriphagus lutimaris]MBN3520382.1 hypothetical protein [Algoriphagus lutimaris]
MSNDPEFNSEVKEPTYKKGKGPKILLDGAHHNFFIQWDFIKPFSDLAKADGYQTIVDSSKFTPEYLKRFDVVMIITSLPFNFTTKNQVTDESTFSKDEINSLYDWVNNGGSLLVFSEHAPFDQAINPLLNQFGIESSIGTTIDSLNYNKEIGRTGWIEFTKDNGLLNIEHPIVKGRTPSNQVNRLLTFGGSGLNGKNYTNLLRLSESSENVVHSTGVGPIGKGNSQALAGNVGKGKVVALGDSNGFTAMVFDQNDGTKQKAGMNLENYDWKQFVLNTLYWLSTE